MCEVICYSYDGWVGCHFQTAVMDTLDGNTVVLFLAALHINDLKHLSMTCYNNSFYILCCIILIPNWES